jgi:hypothetical protein
VSVLRDIALILLALEATVLLLVAAALALAVDYMLLRLRWWHVLPRWFIRVRGSVYAIQRAVGRGCRRIAGPLISVATARATLYGWVRGLLREISVIDRG